MTDNHKETESARQDIKDVKCIKLIVKKKVKALVEKLYEGHVLPEDEFKSLCLLLGKDEYDSITEERSLYEFCGYPLCRNRNVAKPIRQEYLITEHHIMKSSERLRFCSKECYFSSMFLKDHLSDQPGWKNMALPPPKVLFFHEVDDLHRHCYKMKDAVGFNNMYTIEQIKDMMLTKEKHPNEVGRKDAEVRPQREDDEKVHPLSTTAVHPSSTDGIQPLSTDVLQLSSTDVVQSSSTDVVQSSSTDVVQSSSTDVVQSLSTDVVQLSSSAEIQQLDKMELRRSTPERVIDGKESGKEKRFEKLRRFAVEWVESKYIGMIEKSEDKSLAIGSITGYTNVQNVRRSIVKDKLVKSFGLNSLRIDLGANQTSVVHQCKELLDHFKFSNKNILLDPLDWNAMALIFIQMFSSNNESLREFVNGEKWGNHLLNVKMTTEEVIHIADVLSNSNKKYTFN